MYVVIKPIKQEEDFICVDIAEADFETPFYREVFETEHEVYICMDYSAVLYWLVFVAKFMTKEQVENLVPEDFKIFSFEFNYSTKRIRVISCIVV